MLNCYLVQFDIVWENRSINLLKISDLLRNPNPINSLILLPEMFNNGFSMNIEVVAENMDGPTLQWMQETASSYNSIVAGSLVIKENSNYYNRFIWCFPDGKYKYYNKRHLFRMEDEEKYYSPGAERVIVEYMGFKFLPIICYDIRFPVWIRNKNDYDVIVCSANWPISRYNAWNTLLKARAIENQSYVLAANRIGKDNKDTQYCGESLAIDFIGETMAIASEQSDIVITIQLDLEELKKFRSSFPAWKDADSFQINM